MAALFRRLGDAAPYAEPVCIEVEGGRSAATSAHRFGDGQPSRLCRGRAEGARVLYWKIADRRRYPDEFRGRDGKSVRQAWALSEPDRLAVADACAAGVPALGRK